jgi:hypothetical protein
MKLKLPNIEINGTLYKGVNDAKLKEIAAKLFETKTDEITVGVQLSPNAKTLGYKKYTFKDESPELKLETIEATITELAYLYTLHSVLRKAVLVGLEKADLKKTFKKLIKELIGGMKVHKDAIVITCNEHAIVIQGLIPNKAESQKNESLPPIFTLIDEDTKALLAKIKDLGAIEGCKIFYMTSSEIK